MSDLSLSRSAYANRRSPAALAAAIALNGGLVGLLIAVPVTLKIMPHDPPMRVYKVPLAPPPPPVADPPPQAVEHPIAQPQPQPVQPPRPTVVEPIVPLVGNGPITGIESRLEGDASGAILPPIAPPAEPVLVKASPDPRFAARFRPAYPPALRREGLEGSVTVRVTIDEQGRVVAIEQVRATHPAFFEETRQQALRAWRFRPAMRDGVPVRSEQVLTVQFRMED